MKEVMMFQGHVIDPAEVNSGKAEGNELRVTFRNGEVIMLRCGSAAESAQIQRSLGLNEDGTAADGLAVVDCTELDWRRTLKQHLEEGTEVDLMHLDYTMDGEICERFANSHGMGFEWDAAGNVGRFRRGN